MDNLKSFIDNNRDGFEHIDDTGSSNADKLYQKIILQNRKKIIWSFFSAAMIIISIFLIVYKEQIQYKIIDSQIVAYKLKESEIISQIYTNTHINKEDIAYTIDIIIREAIPLEEQLPEVMPYKYKYQVIKEYNEQRLEALNRLLETTKQNNETNY